MSISLTDILLISIAVLSLCGGIYFGKKAKKHERSRKLREFNNKHKGELTLSESIQKKILEAQDEKN